MAMGLLSRNTTIQDSTAALLSRMEDFASTRTAVNKLNFFLLSSFNRHRHAAQEGQGRS